VGTGRCPTTVAWFEKQCASLKVSNFEQTIAVHICWTGNHRGIALSGPNPAPPSIIVLGGVVLSRVSSFVNFAKVSKIGQRVDSDDPMVTPSPSRHGTFR
jgi:hypothetical protein